MEFSIASFGEKFRKELGKVMLSCRKKRISENCSIDTSSVTTDTTTTNRQIGYQ